MKVVREHVERCIGGGGRKAGTTFDKHHKEGSLTVQTRLMFNHCHFHLSKYNQPVENIHQREFIGYDWEQKSGVLGWKYDDTPQAPDCDKYGIILKVQTSGKYHGNSQAIYNKAS